LFDLNKQEFTMTKKGLRMDLLPMKEEGIRIGRLVAPLNCSRERNCKPLGARLRRTYKDQFLRVSSQSHLILDKQKRRMDRTTVYIKQRSLPRQTFTKPYIFEFTAGNLIDNGFGFPGTFRVGYPKLHHGTFDSVSNLKFSLLVSGLPKSFT
jgi:hypothetical protein